MIEERLFEFGVLGVWVVVLLFDRYYFRRKLMEKIERNAELLYTIIGDTGTFIKKDSIL